MTLATEIKNGQTFTNGTTSTRFEMVDSDSLLIKNLNTGKTRKLSVDSHVYEVSNKVVKNSKKATPRNLKAGDKVEFDFSYLGCGNEIKEVLKVVSTKSGKRFNVFFTDGSKQLSNGAIGIDTPVA